MNLFWTIGVALLAVSSGDETCHDGGAVGTGDRASGHNLQWTKVENAKLKVFNSQYYSNINPYKEF